jgi:neutral ceramidase
MDLMKQLRSLTALIALSLIWAPPPALAANPLQVGAATTIITPPIGSWKQGAGVTRKGERIRDELEANVLYISDGETPLLLISCDLVGLNLGDVVPIREAISRETDVPPRQVILTCTHTHSGPSLLKTNYHMPVDRAYIDSLLPKLVTVSAKAVAQAQAGKIGWGLGEAQIGFNRRACWEDGSHSMHGNSKRIDFAGLEGPDDPAHLALFAVDSDQNPVAVLYHNTSHPTNFYNASLFSSDYADEARKIIRAELGDIPVLYLNGAQGDINMNNLLAPKKEDREDRLKRIGKMLADETLRLYHEADFHAEAQLGHEVEDLEIEVRLPDAEAVSEARKVLARVDAGENITGMNLILPFGTVHLQEEYGERPVDTLPVHALRIGDVALVTQPCELYCQFGLDIKRRSPAPLTAVVGLADGYCGYCPTIAGVMGGGYSGQPISWTRLEPFAGYRIVEAAGPMLNRLWRESD